MVYEEGEQLIWMESQGFAVADYYCK